MSDGLLRKRWPESVMEVNSSMAMHGSPLGLFAFVLLAFAPISTRAAECGSTASPKLDWQECTKKNLMLQGSDLEGANLFSTDFSLTDLSGANVKSANLDLVLTGSLFSALPPILAFIVFQRYLVSGIVSGIGK